MIVKEFLALTHNNINLMLEDDSAEDLDKFVVFKNKAYLLHGDYLNATIVFIRPLDNGFCLRVKLV